jgi:hypothetical protein
VVATIAHAFSKKVIEVAFPDHVRLEPSEADRALYA